MGYNESRDWLEQQSDTMHQLVEIANTGGVSQLEFKNIHDARKYQFYISNVLHSMAIYYPHYRDVAQSVRTWQDKQWEAGRFMVFVGTPNNFTYQRKGKTHLHRRLPPPSIPGRPPNRPDVLPKASPPYAVPTDRPPDIFEHDEEVNDDNIMALIQPIRNVAEMRSSVMIKLTNMRLSADVAKAFVDSMDEWVHDDSERNSDGVYTKLTLRRRSTTEEVAG